MQTQTEYLTARQTANKIGTAKHNILGLLQNGKIAGAKKQQNEITGQDFWMIPVAALDSIDIKKSAGRPRKNEVK